MNRCQKRKSEKEWRFKQLEKGNWMDLEEMFYRGPAANRYGTYLAMSPEK
jgi:hypothetical protein